jgi:hypothetical protein
MSTLFTRPQNVQYEIPYRSYDIYSRPRRVDPDDVAAILSFALGTLVGNHCVGVEHVAVDL